MAKQPMKLDGLVDPGSRPASGGARQRGGHKPSGQAAPTASPKRLSVVLDAETYRSLRIHAVETDRTHQDIISDAVARYLRGALPSGLS